MFTVVGVEATTAHASVAPGVRLTKHWACNDCQYGGTLKGTVVANSVRGNTYRVTCTFTAKFTDEDGPVYHYHAVRSAKLPKYGRVTLTGPKWDIPAPEDPGDGYVMIWDSATAACNTTKIS